MRLCQNYFDAAFFVTTSINLFINKGKSYKFFRDDFEEHLSSIVYRWVL